MSGITDTSVREALVEHLAASGLPPDAGDSDLFAVVRIFHLPYPIPNTRARKRAVQIHDLNHLVSGYRTDRIGELEISAWELASGGCRDYVAAWVLDLAGLLGGLMAAPRRTVRAFLAGRSQQNLYGFAYEELLALSVDDACRLADTPLPTRMRRVPGGLHLAALVVLSLPAGIAMSIAWYALVPVWLVNRAFRQVRPAAMRSAQERGGQGGPNTTTGI
ncbi:MAG TPA: hypothetical protein VND70_10230 [Acidimicrobiales bacterium]|nr:hypothetical protein [Acidimicrobiales bacterium]